MTKANHEKDSDMRRFSLEPADRNRLACMVGPEDENLKQIADRLGVEILNTGANFSIKGTGKKAIAAERIIKQLYLETAPVGKQRKANFITPDKVNLAIVENTHLEADQEDSPNPLDFYDEDTQLEAAENARTVIKKQARKGDDSGEERGSVGDLYHKASALKTQRGVIKARTPNQAGYISQIISHDVSFGIGPAGTGKTFLAVAAAVDALTRNEVRRIILTRPAVEAGEKLGFLPGDLSQKVDPYLRPLYDALFEMLGFEKVEKLIERQVIEIAPLAYMRGRTLNDSFIILDEAQNTTIEQMKMFLTRIGFNSKAVITGDPSQIDLPRNVRSGLRHAMEVLSKVDAISFTYFLSDDVVRHPVVAAIVNAYDAWDKKEHEREEREGDDRSAFHRERRFSHRRYDDRNEKHIDAQYTTPDIVANDDASVDQSETPASVDTASSSDNASQRTADLAPVSTHSTDEFERTLQEDMDKLNEESHKVEKAFNSGLSFNKAIDDLMEDKNPEIARDDI